MFVGSFHQIIVTGRVIKDIEMWMNDNEVPIVKMSVPTNNVFRDTNGDSATETTWFSVTLTGPAANAAFKTLKKGDHIQVIGRLVPEVKVREMKNGRIVGEYEVIADEVIFLQGGFKDDR